MNGATTSEREIALGPFCQSTFGCTLYAGQRSRKSLSRSDAEGLNSFHVSNCTVAPPQFTPLLFISFLSLSPSSENGEGHDELAREHIKSTLHRVNRLGSSSSALRIITMKVIELLSQSKDVSELHKDNGGQDNVNEKTLLHMQKWTAGKAILAELVSVVKEIYDPLGFATFFLSVGRQLEPHQFNLIFPLPTEIQTPDSPPPIRTPEDLFSVSCEHGFYEDDVLASKNRNVYRDLMQGVPAYDSIKFFTKRIPCNCLKDLYSRAKSQPKLIQCHCCKKHKERRSLFLCGRCKIAHYCSKECQRTDYLQHESLCKKLGSTLS